MVVGLVVTCAVPSQTWGRQGHRLVGLVAAARLTPLARQQVAWLLDARTLADVSSWADQYIDGNAQTALWHYVNFVPFDAPGFGPSIDVVVDQNGIPFEGTGLQIAFLEGVTGVQHSDLILG